MGDVMMRPWYAVCACAYSFLFEVILAQAMEEPQKWNLVSRNQYKELFVQLLNKFRMTTGQLGVMCSSLQIDQFDRIKQIRE